MGLGLDRLSLPPSQPGFSDAESLFVDAGPSPAFRRDQSLWKPRDSTEPQRVGFQESFSWFHLGYKVGGRVISDGAQIWPPCQVNLKLLAAVLHIPHAFVEPLLRGPSVGDALEEEAY